LEAQIIYLRRVGERERGGGEACLEEEFGVIKS